MILGGVNIPDRLLDAIETGNLVVFAGAGVSMGEPANKPSFWKLAEAIARGTGEEPHILGTDANGKQIWEPLDQFLGRLTLDNRSLKERAIAEIETGTPHTELHESLVRVFCACEQVRVVTTNFDLLFEDACESLWGARPLVYTAPALPLGSRFQGVVHVHGAVSSVDSIVLTDADFGRAYLTEGWARRFLVDLFEHFTVLFVGYSHDDTVLQYLARALPDKAKGKRYAMVSSDQSPEKWSMLGIEPVQFNKENPGDFSTLYAASTALADLANRPHSDWQEMIGDIARNSPSSISIEDEECIRRALSDVSKVRYFCQQARSAEWVVWLDSQKALNELFDDGVPDSKGKLLGDWLVKHISEQKPDRLFQLIGKHHDRLGPWLWHGLAHQIGLSNEDSSFDRWVDVLLQTKPYPADVYHLQWLAEKSHRLGMVDRVLRIFESMAETRVNFREPYRGEGAQPYRIRAEMEIHSPEWNLNEVWTNCIHPHLETQYSKVLAVCQTLLLDRHQLACAWSGASAERDWDSRRRNAIRPHEQDEYPEAIDVVINAARASVERMAEDAPQLAIAWLEGQANSPSQLLQRLSIHCIDYLEGQSPDERLQLLKQRGIPSDVYQQEAFAVLHTNYADASQAIKEGIVEEILTYQAADTEDTGRQSAIEHIQWLSVLKAAEPDCELVGAAIADIQQVYHDLAIQPYPSPVSGSEDEWTGYESPWSVEDLLRQDSSEWFGQLRAFEGEGGFRGPSRSGLLSAIADAAKQKTEWGFSLCDYLRSIDAWESDFWPRLLRGLGHWPEAREQAEPLLLLINTDQLVTRYQREIADIILASVKSGGVAYVCDILPNTNALATNIWDSIGAPENPIEDVEQDWLQSAINKTEGVIAEYWVYALDASNRCNGKELREPYRSELGRLCSEDDPKTQYSIPVITQQVSFLLGLDQSWAEETIRPLFSSGDDERASQAWHGFLGCRGPTEQVFKSLQNEFLEAIPRLDTILLEKKSRFFEFYAAVAFWYVDDPNENWMPRLLNVIPEEDRVVLAKQMEGFLRHMNDESRASTWSQWLEDYWKNRIAGVPRPLTQGESRAMLKWSLYLGEEFPSGVDVATQMQKPNLTQGTILHEMHRMGLGEQFPEGSAKLLTYILECPAEPMALYGIDKLCTTLSEQVISAPIKGALNEALIGNGYEPI